MSKLKIGVCSTHFKVRKEKRTRHIVRIDVASSRNTLIKCVYTFVICSLDPNQMTRTSKIRNRCQQTSTFCYNKMSRFVRGFPQVPCPHINV